MSEGFAGRRIVVTGAAQGIGLATVERFVAAGGKVGCLDRDARALAGLAERFDAETIHTAVCDVAISTEVAQAIEACAEALGGIDGVVNSAGVDLVSPIEAISDEAWARIMAVNLSGPMHVCRAAFPHLRAAGGGTIVNVSSGAGLQPLRHRSAYSASKAALQMFSKSLSMEAAEFGIRVNTVCPGAVETALLHSSITEDADAALAAIRNRYALGRIATPDEIAAAIFWLSGPESSYVTGTAMAVDGGRTFH
ncbi:SDR family oxidoreductase [Mesorhizobium sp. KR2-14]|uniref:SDR family NAD(P)-dependent oxidoreductase n=1 Tax=Mesorhizobium sp. KR2-14 TaxID=3156610 RepID=UPI0032B348EA